MPQPMNRAAEVRLVAALSDVVDRVAAGDSPTLAVAKSARAADLPAGYVTIMANSYNVGRTTRQREDGEDAAEKAADFDIADGAAALEILFPDRPAPRAADQPVDDAYSRPPAARRKAAAYLPMPVVAVTDRSATYVGVEVARLLANRERDAAATKLAADATLLSRAADAAGADAARLEYGLRERAAKLANYFAVGRGLSVDDVRANVSALHGEAGLSVLAGVSPRGRYKAAGAPRHHRVDREPAYAEIAAVISLAGEVVEARAARDTLRKAAAPSRPTGPPNLLDRLSKRALNLIDTSLAGGIYAMAGDVVHGFKGKTPDQMVEKQLSRVASPEHEEGLRAIQTQALMHEMLADDEVLRGHDPVDVTNAYNRISRYAPHIASQPMTAIPLVRKALAQGQLDSFDAKEVADTEDKYRKSREPSAEPSFKPAAKPAGGA